VATIKTNKQARNQKVTNMGKDGENLEHFALLVGIPNS
jgi:hypothetical protein